MNSRKTGSNIAELTRSEERMAKELAATASVVNDMLLGEIDDAETEKRVLDACLTATDSQYGMIGKINEYGQYDTTTYDSRTLQACAFPEALAWEMSTGMPIRGIWGWPMLHNKPLICNDLESHPDRAGHPKGHVRISCFLGVPLRQEGKAIGMVAVANKEGGYSEEDRDTLVRLASIISISRQHRVAMIASKATRQELEQLVEERTKRLLAEITERTHAEEKLSQREHYFRSLVNKMHEDIVVIDPNYEITDINNSFMATSGLKRQEVIGRHCYEISHGYNSPCSEHGERCKLIETIKTGQPGGCQHQHLRKDGTKSYVDVLLSPLKDKSGKVTHVIEAIRDISELIKAQEEIKKLNSAVEQSVDGVLMTGGDRRISFANDAYAAMHGYDPEEINGRLLEDLSIRSDAGLVENIHDALSDKGSWSGEVTHVKKDGTRFPVYITNTFFYGDDGGRIGLVQTAKDITEQKRMEQELKDYSENLEKMVNERTQELKNSEERYSTLFNNANDAVIVYNRAPSGLPGKCIDANDVACRMLGYTMEELLDKMPTELGDPDIKHDYDAISKSLNEEGHVVFETVRVTKDGAKIPVECSSYRFEYEGEPTIVSLARDISERKKAEAELKETQNKLAHAEKLAAVGQLASGVAHDLRNPLTVINNSAHFLKLKLSGADDKVHQYLDMMQKAVLKSSNVIEALLDLARTKEPALKDVDISSITTETINSIDIPENVKLIVEQDDDLQKVTADANQIERVFSNLVNNAVQAMPDGGTLTISSYQNKKLVITEFHDTGKGIAEENLKKVFEPLFTTKANAGGTGIGLAVSKTIVEAHKGSIKVKSEIGKGTTFIVKLPNYLEEHN